MPKSVLQTGFIVLDSVAIGIYFYLELTISGLKYTSAHIRSIPALAHKVFEQCDNVLQCYLRAIDQTTTYRKKYISIVIDTFDTGNFID